jgi:hypothetical protein
MNLITMESIEMDDQLNVKAFLKRRGVVVMIGMMMYLLIVLFHLYKI